MDTVHIKLDYNIELEVKGSYSPYRPSMDYYQPPDEEEFEIDSVLWDDNDITDLLFSLEAFSLDITELEEMCCEYMRMKE